MRCMTCGYRLWHLKSRRCPECGTEFKPSDFEFTPQSVQFCCPHCNQSYYGTSQKGHLRPIEFDCVSCGQHIHMDEMVVSPTEGVDEQQTQIEQMPWLQREERGSLSAWFATIKMALASPSGLMKVLPPDSSLASAWWFAILVHIPVCIFGPTSIVLFPLIMGAIAGSHSPGGAVGAFLAAAFFAMLISMGLVVAAIVIWSLITHGILHWTGQTASSFERTMQAVCYSSGANIISAIPCCGFYVGPVYWIVSAVLMVTEAQRVRGVRGVLAVLMPPGIAILALAGLWGGFMYWSAGMASRMAASQPWRMQTSDVLSAVMDYSMQHSGNGPDHAIQLLTEGLLNEYDLLDSRSSTSDTDVPIADTTLDQFAILTPGEQQQIVQKAIQALPAGTVAHRLGDYVFTYHGMNLNNADPKLWIVVKAPDPDVNPAASVSSMFVVGLADGSVSYLSTKRFAKQLARQKKIRAANNLPAIPDPRMLRHIKMSTKNVKTSK